MTAEIPMRYRRGISTATIEFKFINFQKTKILKPVGILNFRQLAVYETMRTILFFKLTDIKVELGNGLIQNGGVSAGSE